MSMPVRQVTPHARRSAIAPVSLGRFDAPAQGERRHGVVDPITPDQRVKQCRRDMGEDHREETKAKARWAFHSTV